MTLIPTNSVGGYSTGLTMTAVIDPTANITGVGATFTGTFSGTTGSFSRLLTASAGISAAGGVTLAGTLQGTTGSFSKLLTLSDGLSAAGGFTVGNDISVFGIRVGRGNRGASAGGDTNLAVGANALKSVIPNPGSYAGIQNLAFGTSALELTTSGGYNSAFGTEALYTNTSGGGNIAFGVHALRQNTSGAENCAFGGGPMYQNTTGSYNTAIGSLAYYYKSTGSYNVAIGFQAGYNFGTPRSGSNVTSATNCTLIGTYATPLTSGSTNEIVIGYDAIGKGSDTVSIGNSSITATHLTGVVNVSSGVCAAGSTFSSTTNTLDVIASTDGAGLRIAKAVTGANSRIGGIRFGRSGTTALNTYLEGSAGTLTIYNGVDTTGSKIVDFAAATTGFSGDVTATGSIVGNQKINAQTVSYTLALTDNGKIVTMNSASGITATIPLNSSVAFPTGCSVTVVGIGTGVVGFTGSAGVTLRFTPGNILRAQYSAATCVKLATNEWLLLGDLTA